MERLNETDYNAFKERMLEHIRPAFPDDTEIKVVPNMEINDPYLESIIVKPAKQNGVFATSASIPVCEILWALSDCENEQEIFDLIAGNLRDLHAKSVNASESDIQKTQESAETKQNWPEITDKIIIRLINTEMNEKLLKKVPHRKMLDLAVIYQIVIKSTKNCFKSAIINNEMMKSNNLSEEQLHDRACRYMKDMEMRFLPIDKEAFCMVIKGFDTTRIFQRHSRAINISMEPEQLKERTRAPESLLFMAGLDGTPHGSALIHVPGMLDKICTLFGWETIGIAPDTTETIMIFDLTDGNAKNAQSVKETLKETNDIKNRESILSDNVYIYDSVKGRISIF